MFEITPGPADGVPESTDLGFDGGGAADFEADSLADHPDEQTLTAGDGWTNGAYIDTDKGQEWGTFAAVQLKSVDDKTLIGEDGVKIHLGGTNSGKNTSVSWGHEAGQSDSLGNDAGGQDFNTTESASGGTSAWKDALTRAAKAEPADMSDETRDVLNRWTKEAIAAAKATIDGPNAAAGSPEQDAPSGALTGDSMTPDEHAASGTSKPPVGDRWGADDPDREEIDVQSMGGRIQGSELADRLAGEDLRLSPDEVREQAKQLRAQSLPGMPQPPIVTQGYIPREPNDLPQERAAEPHTIRGDLDEFADRAMLGGAQETGSLTVDQVIKGLTGDNSAEAERMRSRIPDAAAMADYLRGTGRYPLISEALEAGTVEIVDRFPGHP